MFLTGSCASPPEDGAGTGARPNIVLIMADDMGYGDVQALNDQSEIPTPNLNRLAEQGMTFTDAHTPASVCTPTRYGLLTGRYSWRTRLKQGVLYGYSRPLIKEDRPTLASMLKNRGYRTGMVGKWHLGMDMPKKAGKKPTKGDPRVDFDGHIDDTPIDRGFDRFFGISASLDMPPFAYIKNDRFVGEGAEHQERQRFPAFVRTGPRSEGFELEEVLGDLTERAESYVREFAGDSKPFFLYFALTAPHKPVVPPERFQGATDLGPYGDFVAQVDWSVGRVMEALEKQGVRDETIVIYTSDNGSYMARRPKGAKGHVDNPSIQAYRSDRHRANDIYRGTKADIWEAGHRVPFFVRWPGHVEPGSTAEQTICLTDVYATLAQVTGHRLRKKEAEDSFSLLPVLNGRSWDRGAPVIHHSHRGIFAIRKGKWKLVAGNGSGGRAKPIGKPFKKPYFLFNMEKDPREQQNLASEYPERVERLENRIRAIQSSGRSRPVR